ncbi:MAG: peptidylprolyl isomerase [Betaproteobacteria bacterium]|jgi:cyclophilin family peptidyl-prolyl cis-trans isomerase|nr:peptidylprolyl isomerase [Betaproteobacteria bacterium]MDH4293656.1 peptidylprolyl isomerase [Betaproteobacteria bacterium]MDH5341829.1 peptidylprolyl isomerase [Betaproteobacteria bacterium]
MKHLIALLLALTLIPAALAANPKVEMKTTLGTIVIELYPENAPKTVENFLQYVNDGFYDGTIFHRVIPGFMAQGGGFTPNLQQKPTRAAIRNEAGNGLRNATGTVAMARTADPHSATAQFFINVSENDFLDFKSADEKGYGYTVFGRISSGMDVVQKMIATPTATTGPHQNVPRQPIVIERARVLGAAAKPQKSK